MNRVINISKVKKERALLKDILIKLMEKSNININQLSKNTGLANTTIKRMCTDSECNPTLFSLKALAEFFGVTTNQLVGDELLPQDVASYYPQFEHWINVPIVSLEQVAVWPSNIEEIKESATTKYVKTDLEVSENIFAVIAKDESLEPRFPEGTILIFNPDKIPSNKDFVVLLLPNKQIPQFRQVLIDGPDIYVKAINPTFAESGPILLNKNKSKILGTLIQAKSNYI